MDLQGDALMVKVNKLTSTKTQLPYSYYSLPYCRPEKIVDSAENLGEVLRGDRIENSPFVVCMFPSFVLSSLLGSFSTCALMRSFSVCVAVQNEGIADVRCRLSCEAR